MARSDSERINDYARAMRAAAHFARYDEKERKSERIESTIVDLLYKIELTKTSIEKKRKIQKHIYKMLDKVLVNQRHTTASDIRKYIEQYYVKPDYNEREIISKYAREISDSPLSALKNYMGLYISSVERMREEEAKKAAAEKREEERKAEEARKKVERETREIERSSSYRSSSSSSYSYNDYVTTRSTSSRSTSSRSSYVDEEQKESSKPSYSAEKVKEIVNELLDSKKEYSYSDNDKLDTMIRSCEKIDGVSSYSYHNYRDIIETMYKYFKLTDKKRKPKGITAEYQNIVDMGISAQEIMFEHLVDPQKYDLSAISELYYSFRPSSVLSRYNGARARWLKRYKHLNRKNKRRVDSVAESKDDYRKMFDIYGVSGADVAEKDDIIAAVNKKAREYILNDSPFHHIDRVIRNHIDTDYSGKFTRMVSYMSIEEIASLYHSLVSKNSQSYRYYGPSETAYDDKKEREANFQRFIAEIISNRLTGRIKNINDEKEMEQHSKDIISICREILGEEPKPDYYQSQEKSVSTDYSKQRVETIKAVAEAKRRYYGMGKFQKTVALLNKRKLQRLSKQELLDGSELDQVNKMFRR